LLRPTLNLALRIQAAKVGTVLVAKRTRFSIYFDAEKELGI